MRTILNYIKFISRRNLILPIIILAIMVILLIALPVRDILFPLRADSATEIVRQADAGRRYIKINISDMKYTGYDFYKGDHVAASYYYILEDDSQNPVCLFFLIPNTNDTPPEDTLEKFQGNVSVLRSNIYFSQFLNDFSKDVGWSSEGLAGFSHGVLLSRYDYHPAVFIILTLAILIVIVTCVIYCLLNTITILDPSRHEACRRLRRFGLDSSDFKQIDNELKNNCVLRAGSLYVTDHYLIAFTQRSIYVIPLYNIVWIYKYSTLKRFSRSGILNYTLTVITEPSGRIAIPGCAKKDADAVLRFMRRNFRHITVGYSEENRRKFEIK